MVMRVADYIMSRIVEAGADTVFMLSGGGMMHLVDAVGRNDDLRYICNHHEQPSAIAADAYARRSGGIGVCLATSGPGATNVLTGLVGAWQDSSPVLFLTGQSKTTQTIQLSGIPDLRQFGTFEVDIVPIVTSVTKYAVMVTDPKTIRYHLEKALFLARSGRPGPVLLDLPLDVQGAMVEIDDLEGFEPPAVNTTAPSLQVVQVVEALAKARRPLILAGHGIRCAGASASLQALAEFLEIPVVTSQLGKDVLPYAHPLFVGHPGPKGDRPGNFAVQTADLILALGCSLHSQTTGWESNLFAPEACKILVDPDAAVLAREQVSVGIKVQAEVSAFIEALLTAVPARSSNMKWRNVCANWKQQYAVCLEPHDRSRIGINFYDFAERLSDILPENACLVTDAGSAFYVMGQAFRVKQGQRFISSGSLGAMGFALPAANGAACAGGGVTVCVTGDGSLMTNIHDLSTTIYYRLNVKIFLIDNNGYLSIRNTQKDFFNGLLVGTDEKSGVFIPSMEKICESYNIPFLNCENIEEVNVSIRQALAMDGPVFVRVKAMFDQKIIPSVSSVRLPDGRMQSKPLHDMVPYLPSEQINAEMAAAREIYPE